MKVIKKNNKGTRYAQAIECLEVIKIPEGGNAIFNVEPIMTTKQQEKFEEALKFLDSLISQPQAATTHYMGL